MVPRYMAFAFPPPEVVANSYRFKPMGIFSLENKVIKSAQFMDWFKSFFPTGVVDPAEAAKYSAQVMGTSDEVDKMVHPAPMMPGMPPPGGPPMPPGPGMQGGPNGDQPNFLPPPPNELRRQPVASAS